MSTWARSCAILLVGSATCYAGDKETTTPGTRPTEPHGPTEPFLLNKPLVDNFTGHELCFTMSFLCPVHSCVQPPEGCFIVDRHSPLVPWEIDLNGQCCPAPCFAVSLETGKPCMSSDKLPVKPDVIIDDWNPTIDVPGKFDEITGREVCYHEDEACPSIDKSDCPEAPEGCALLENMHGLLEIDPETQKCCRLQCASKHVRSGKLCSWIDHMEHSQDNTTTDEPVQFHDDDTFAIIDEYTGKELCFEESTGCAQEMCDSPPPNCHVITNEDAPLVKVNETKCCHTKCIMIDDNGRECTRDGPDSSHVGVDLPTEFTMGGTSNVKLCFHEDEDCPEYHCADELHHRRRRRTDGVLAFGCHYIRDEFSMPLMEGSDGRCCKMPCLAIDALGKTCADNLEPLDAVVNGSQVEPCFELSGTCPEAECAEPPAGCHFMDPNEAPLFRTISGACCTDPCLVVNSTTGKMCEETTNLPWMSNFSNTSTGIVEIDTESIEVCVEIDAHCDMPQESCGEAPAGCHFINSTQLVKQGHKCCPLGCVAVDEGGKQCPLKPNNAVEYHVGDPCHSQASTCPRPRCAHFMGCKLDFETPLAIDEEGHCCPIRLCPFVQDPASSHVCEHASTPTGEITEAPTETEEAKVTLNPKPDEHVSPTADTVTETPSQTEIPNSTKESDKTTTTTGGPDETQMPTEVITTSHSPPTDDVDNGSGTVDEVDTTRPVINHGTTQLPDLLNESAANNGVDASESEDPEATGLIALGVFIAICTLIIFAAGVWVMTHRRKSERMPTSTKLLSNMDADNVTSSSNLAAVGSRSVHTNPTYATADGRIVVSPSLRSPSLSPGPIMRDSQV